MWQHPITRGAVSGLVAAAAVDLAAFRSWKRVQDVLAYDWQIAIFRWVQGAVLGAVAAVGLGAL